VVKHRLIKCVPLIYPGIQATFYLYLYLENYGCTPYKVSSVLDQKYVKDFWLEQFKTEKAVDKVEHLYFKFSYWFAFEPKIGLKVIIESSDLHENPDIMYERIINEGVLLLTAPEFEIHCKLQEQYFRNERDIQWD